ncbi:MFS transporter [Herbiconiux moechotypicola]|uniref:MFS transporter n=1 Tax=Herbiconiux moechotypicola TaxID=637393 RepID=UPI00217CEB4D|nr:MFS transporter [Herbiconiux moechotypicola]MCS5730720.1 MFS transporter [Herbiconiux moechotypicola]
MESWPGFVRGDRGYRRIVVALFAAGFATFAQIFGAQAVLPVVRDDLGAPASTAALLVSVTTVGLAVSVLPWSWVADRLGRVRAMKVSLVAATVLSLLAPLAPGFGGVLTVRGLVGLALGAVPAVAVAYLAEELHVDWVGVAAGTYVAGNTLGGIVGRVTAGPMAELAGWREGMLVVAALSALSAAVFLLVVPRSRGFGARVGGDGVGAPTFAVRVWSNLRDPSMVSLYVVGFLVMGSFGAVYNYLGFHVTEPPFGVPETLVSLLFVSYLAGTVASRGSGALTRRFGVVPVMLAGLAIMVLGLGLLAVDQLAVAVVGLVVFTVGCFTAHPVASGLSGRWARVGRAQSTALYQLAWLGGTAFFGWVIGVVYDHAGWWWVLGAIGGMCAVAALVVVTGLRGRAASE